MNQLLSINPLNQTIINKHKLHTSNQIQKIIEEAQKHQLEWYSISLKNRKVALKKFAQILLKEKKALAQIAALEMGKPILQGIAEVEKCARSIQYYINQADEFLAPINIPTEAKSSYASFQPLGTVLAIMPWNFPYWQVCRAIAPIMLSGNVMILKHASNVTSCALALKEIWNQASHYTNAFQVIKTKGSEMEKVISHPSIAAVTFTGSSSAGAAVAAVAAKHLKKQVLELGGSDPYLILEDADIDLAVEKCTHSRLNNTGQSCIAAKRLIVVEAVKEKFIQKLKAKFETKKFGNPLDPQFDLGPMARQDLRDELHQQVLNSTKKGAKIILGGYVPEGKNAFYPPTILTQVKKGMPAYEEEMFGPVACIIAVKDEAAAIKVANDTTYGLGAAVFSKNIKKAEKIAIQVLQAGFVAINDFVSSDPRLPFGGIKQSGYGRELAHFGLLEFCNIKTILVR